MKSKHTPAPAPVPRPKQPETAATCLKRAKLACQIGRRALKDEYRVNGDFDYSMILVFHILEDLADAMAKGAGGGK
jgi:hypothetical protein